MKVGLFADKSAEKAAEAAGEAVPVVPPPQPGAAAVPVAGNLGEVSRRRNCFCGCSVRTGAIVIGTLSVVHGFMMLYMSLLGINALYSTGKTTLAFILLILFGLVHLVTGMGLIHGADRGRPKLVAMWLYTRYTELGLYLGYFVISVGHLIYLGAPAQIILSAIASCVLGACLLGYCISVVRCFHIQLLGAAAVIAARETV